MMDGRKDPVSSDGEMEGLDDTQRAEVHAYEGGGPSNGDVLTDLTRDRGEDYVEDERRPEFAPNTPDEAAMSGNEYEEVGEEDEESDA